MDMHITSNAAKVSHDGAVVDIHMHGRDYKFVFTQGFSDEKRFNIALVMCLLALDAETVLPILEKFNVVLSDGQGKQMVPKPTWPPEQDIAHIEEGSNPDGSH